MMTIGMMESRWIDIDGRFRPTWQKIKHMPPELVPLALVMVLGLGGKNPYSPDYPNSLVSRDTPLLAYSLIPFAL